MRKYAIFMIAGFACQLAFAQQKNITGAAQKTLGEPKLDTVKRWDVGGPLSVSFTQTGFSNWAAGGQNSIGLTSLVSFHANYSTPSFNWLNEILLGYGFTQLQDQPVQKTTDQIDVTTSAGVCAFDHAFVSFLANFQTQFAPGYTNAADTVLLSRFMSPGYLVLSLGLNYKPNKDLMVFLSPASARLVFVGDQNLANAGDFGVTPAVRGSNGEIITKGKNELTEFGAYFKASYKHSYNDHFTLATTLELFSNYLKDPQNIVVNWSALLQFKVSKYLAVTFNAQTIYDNSVNIPIYKTVNGVNKETSNGPRLQLKDVLGVGLGFKI